MITVIIPTFNAKFYLSQLIESLKGQTIDHELIILDSESNDDTREFLYKANIPFVHVPKASFNHGSTRNMGVELAKNEIVLFLTQDALPVASNTLEILVKTLYDYENVAMAYGRQIPYPNTGIFGQFARYSNYPKESLLKNKSSIKQLGIKTCSCSNSFSVYRKSLLQKIGGFPSNNILGEDVSVAAQFILQGYDLAYSAEAQVFHSHDYSLTQEFKRYFDIGVFHQQQQLVLEPFTNVESAGFRYVVEESNYLIRNGAYNFLPIQYLRTLAKYIGYKIGHSHNRFPQWFNRSLSMHRSFWQ